MKHLLIRDDDHALIVVDLTDSMFMLTWKGPVPSASFRRILVQAHMQVVQHHLRFWLSDSRLLGAISAEDEQWMKDLWTPRITQAGIERLAILPSKDLGYQRTISRLLDQDGAMAPFPVHFFEEHEDARRWLKGRVRGTSRMPSDIHINHTGHRQEFDFL